MSKRFTPLIFILCLLLIIIVVVPVLATNHTCDETSPCIELAPGLPAGSDLQVIIKSGDEIGDILFEGIPDGIGLTPGDAAGTVDVYVAHEQTTVPFFGTADFQDASVSKLTLSMADASVLDASVVISPEEGYKRFCSASIAGSAEGFAHPTFFAGEEANDIIEVPDGAPYGSDPAVAPLRQAGYVVAYNTVTGQSKPIPGMGRLNHENTVVIPGGWNQFAILTTDDTFDGPSAQLYMYLASQEAHVMEDKGGLWAFRVTRTEDGPVNPNDAFNGANDYLDIRPGDDWQGEFIRVPRKIALGQTDEAPQDALENWSNDNNVFQFIRLEDLDYDRNDPLTVYVADTGRSRVVPDPTTGRMVRGPSGTVGQADNGSVFKFVFNAKNPRKVDSFSVLAQGDDSSSEAYVPFISPDNMGTSVKSLMVQEDTDDARIWQYRFASDDWRVVATVTDPDGESSGIVDASDYFGDGAWILDVQGHGVYIKEELQPDGTLFKRESGQLLLMKIPGS